MELNCNEEIKRKRQNQSFLSNKYTSQVVWNVIGHFVLDLGLPSL